MFEVTDEEFDAIVEDAIASIPQEFLSAIDNVSFHVENNPNPSQAISIDNSTSKNCDENDSSLQPLAGKILLGLYSGIALPKRNSGYGTGQVPDIITIYKASHERVCSSLEQMKEQVRRTVVHEVGHYFGMDEEQLRKMGYGSA